MKHIQSSPQGPRIRPGYDASRSPLILLFVPLPDGRRIHRSVLTFRSLSVVSGRSPRLKLAIALVSRHVQRYRVTRKALPSASSQALPAPKPAPSHTGHARLLKSRTEKMTPNERPRPDRITSDESARSHCYVWR